MLLLCYQLANPYVVQRSFTLGNLLGPANACAAFLLLTWLLGRDSGLYVVIVIAPLIVLLVAGSEHKPLIIGVFAMSSASLVIGVNAFEEPAKFIKIDNALLALLRTSMILVSMAFITGTGFVLLRKADTAEDALEVEHARSEALLYNLLPEDIAARLKVEPDQTIADSLPQVAILFADIVDFTPRAATLPPEEVVGFLNKIFRAFDELAEKHGLEKIKTIGDAYMVAAGMPNPCGDPVHRVAKMALDMQRTVEAMAPEFPEGLQVRIGLHAGPAVAGVIGNRKLFYDVWGETVNTASRMESHGEPGRIQVTTAAKEELDADYEFEPRGTVEVKGIGAVETWWLAGAKV